MSNINTNDTIIQFQELYMRQSLESAKKNYQEIQDYFESNDVAISPSSKNTLFDKLIKSYKILTFICVSLISLIVVVSLLIYRPHSLTSTQIESYDNFLSFIRDETTFSHRSLPSYNQMNSFYRKSSKEDKEFIYSRYVNIFEDYIKQLSRHSLNNEKKGLKTSYDNFIQEELIISEHILHKIVREEKISPLTSNDMQEIMKKLEAKNLTLSNTSQNYLQDNPSLDILNIKQ